MRVIIQAEALRKSEGRDYHHFIHELPIIDAVPVVRCQECKESEQFSVHEPDCLYCGVWDTAVRCDGYCYQGTKMDENKI